MNKTIRKLINNNCGIQDGAIIIGYIEDILKRNERLNKGINEIIQYINSLELGSDHEETYNKDGYLVDVYDIEKMLVELIGSDKG